MTESLFMTKKTDLVATYVREHVRWDRGPGDGTDLRIIPPARIVTPAKARGRNKLKNRDSDFGRNEGASSRAARRQLKTIDLRASGRDGLYVRAVERFEKSLLLLPDEVLDLFLTGARVLFVRIDPDALLPLGMATRSEGPPHARAYVIVAHEENLSWPEDHFIGAFLRELGHVVAQRPPEAEWPQSRGERARYKEHLELTADLMVWKWGLRHYGMAYLTATYPEHWVVRITAAIGKMLLEQK